MTLDKSVHALLLRLSDEAVRLGDVKKLAKEIKKDHDLAMQLWESQNFHPRLLAVS